MASHQNVLSCECLYHLIERMIYHISDKKMASCPGAGALGQQAGSGSAAELSRAEPGRPAQAKYWVSDSLQSAPFATQRVRLAHTDLTVYKKGQTVLP